MQDGGFSQRRAVFTLEAASPAICLLVQLEKHVTEEGGVTASVYTRKEPVSGCQENFGWWTFYTFDNWPVMFHLISEKYYKGYPYALFHREYKCSLQISMSFNSNNLGRACTIAANKGEHMLYWLICHFLVAFSRNYQTVAGFKFTLLCCATLQNRQST